MFSCYYIEGNNWDKAHILLNIDLKKFHFDKLYTDSKIQDYISYKKFYMEYIYLNFY